MIQHNPKTGSKQDPSSRRIADLVKSEISLTANEAGDMRLSQVQDQLCQKFGAREVKFHRLKAKFERGPDYVPGQTHFKNAIKLTDAIHLVIPLREFELGEEVVVQSPPVGGETVSPDRARKDTSSKMIEDDPRGSSSGPRSLPSTGQIEPIPFNQEYLIRDLARREGLHGPMKAGFFVHDLMPRLGFERSQAKQILAQLEAQSLVSTRRGENPNDADHPTTFVELNRKHPQVQRTLANSDEPPKGECNRSRQRND
jgi:hypothetical protein